MLSKKSFIALALAAVLLLGVFSLANARLDFPATKSILDKPALNAPNANSPQAVWLARNVGTARETIAFDATTNAARFILPNGLRSADGSAYWAAFHAGGMTALHSFDVNDGSIRASFGLEGDWELGALAATGKWLALKRTPSESEQAAWTKANTWNTTVALVDTETLKTTRTISLEGNFDLDALNAQGSALYLIQHLPAIKPDHYQVRKYDLALGQLQDGALVDKRNIDEQMAGYPSDQVASPDGTWLFTLYVGMQKGEAFIHALNLKDGYAWCIDLPSGDGDKATLEQYALALAPDGHTIYASNAALGTLAIADVNNIGEPKVMQFRAFAKKSDAPMRNALVSNDGKRVFISAGGAVWELQPLTNDIRVLKESQMPVIGLALDADKNDLLLANADHSVNAIPLATASNISNNPSCPVTKPPVPAFVPPAPYSPKPKFGGFWHGTEKLWTALYEEGTWYALPASAAGYSQKIVWWREGYVGTSELQPALKITGKQLDGNKTFAVEGATNAQSSDFGGNGWAIMSGVEIPSRGCWEITGEYRGAKLSFVVQVMP